jgi:hypothetical protein
MVGVKEGCSGKWKGEGPPCRSRLLEVVGKARDVQLGVFGSLAILEGRV